MNNRPNHQQRKWYALSLIFGAILYCWSPKWQPWASRLHTPLFVLSAPLIAAAMPSGTEGFKKHTGTAVVVLMICYSFYFEHSGSSPNGD